jgi:hypothetical protein
MEAPTKRMPLDVAAARSSRLTMDVSEDMW